MREGGYGDIGESEEEGVAVMEVCGVTVEGDDDAQRTDWLGRGDVQPASLPLHWIDLYATGGPLLARDQGPSGYIQTGCKRGRQAQRWRADDLRGCRMEHGMNGERILASLELKYTLSGSQQHSGVGARGRRTKFIVVADSKSDRLL